MSLHVQEEAMRELSERIELLEVNVLPHSTKRSSSASLASQHSSLLSRIQTMQAQLTHLEASIQGYTGFYKCYMEFKEMTKRSSGLFEDVSDKANIVMLNHERLSEIVGLYKEISLLEPAVNPPYLKNISEMSNQLEVLEAHYSRELTRIVTFHEQVQRLLYSYNNIIETLSRKTALYDQQIDGESFSQR